MHKISIEEEREDQQLKAMEAGENPRELADWGQEALGQN